MKSNEVHGKDVEEVALQKIEMKPKAFHTIIFSSRSLRNIAGNALTRGRTALRVRSLQ
jgi:hypothetical protein